MLEILKINGYAKYMPCLYLYYRVGRRKVRLQQEKNSGHLRLQVATQEDGHRAFLRLVGCYCRFSKSFADMAKLITEATKMDSPDVIIWTAAMPTAFDQL